jgi:CheY-like chemotaxis protein
MSLRERTILVIDDNEDIRDVARVSIEVMGGWRLFGAASGREGVAMASENQPDAILLDYMMPDLDGPGTLSLLRSREDTRSIPVIFLTAREGSLLEGHFCIPKPFDALGLHLQIAQMLGWSA